MSAPRGRGAGIAGFMLTLLLLWLVVYPILLVVVEGAQGDALRTFADDVRALRSRLREALLGMRAEGNRIAGYGAAAKATVLLNYLDLPAGTLEFVVDRNPLKQGRWVPGCRVPVFSPSALQERRPDYLVILAWNIAAEVVHQQTEYRAQGGRFIIPVPDLAVF